MVAENNISNSKMRIAHSKPKVNDIWICKQLYKNAFGENVSIAKPIYLFVVSGIDKQKVGQFAAEIRALRKPEPYKGKGIRYVGEYVIRKAGKSAAKK